MLRSKENLYSETIHFIEDAKDLIILAPYIKHDPLEELLRHTNAKSICIVTSWKPRDVKFGSSDLSVYELCKSNDIKLYINNNIHLKVITKNNISSCIVSSANISDRGLGINQIFNYEMGAIISNPTDKDIIYLDKIMNDENAFVVNDDYYEKIKKESEAIEVNKNMPESFSTDPNLGEKDFLINSLPMSDSVEELMSYYFNKESLGDSISIRSAEHDIQLYKLKDVHDKEQFIKVLKENFLNHPFVVEFLEFNGEGKRFGELTAWIHNRCIDVPTPRRSDIKESLQRVMKFVVLLSDDYEIEKLNHSEKLKKIT